jgi:uncharacterized Ntn-hydrolase superfamily protein
MESVDSLTSPVGGRHPCVIRVHPWLILLFAAVFGSLRGAASDTPLVATFSIVAVDPRTGELGVAVQSRFLAVGAVVPWAKAGVGAIATQSLANTTYGPRGLELLTAGVAPDDAIKQLTAADERRDVRQVGLVSADGRAATFTGAECLAWAGGRTGPNYAAQGNILAGEAVVTAMAESFEKSADTGKELGQRLLDALAAGQAAGGDRRGMQSAALLVVREGWGYSGLNDRYRDLRVDDHAEPIAELQRIYEMHRRIFPAPAENE